MYEELFDYFKKQGLKTGRTQEKLFGWSNEKILQLIDSCNNIIDEEYIKESPTSTFSFIASDSLSGGTSACSFLKCRLNRIDSLARISSLYADKVVIRNPFGKYHHIKKLEKSYKYDITTDIELLFKIEPLLKANLMEIEKETLWLCHDCLTNVIQRNKEIKEKIRNMGNLLENKYLDKIKFKCEILKGNPTIIIEGPDEIIDHSEQTLIIPDEKSLIYDVIMKLIKSGKHEIKKIQIKRYAFLSLLRPRFADILTEDIYTSRGYNSITDQETDIFIREKLEAKETNIEATKLMKNLAHIVPNIENIDIKNLVKIRQEEEESLKVYRDKIDELLNRIRKGTDNRDLKSLFETELRPELNKLDLLFKENKKAATQSFMKKAIISGSYVSIGLFSGLLPANFGVILGILGGYKFIDTISDDLMKMLTTPKEIKTNSYYFLWKVKNISV